MRAIETEYNGYRFRSRLEARWAVFFDALTIPYRYEPEGYDLGKYGRYLPDFWLPEQRYVIEVKGREPSDLEIKKLSAVTGILNADAGFFLGPIPNPDNIDELMHDGWDAYGREGWFDERYFWCECEDCGRIEMQFDGRSDRMMCKDDRGGNCSRSKHGDKGYNRDSPRLLRAYGEARKARFEYGQTPDPEYLKLVSETGDFWQRLMRGEEL